MNESEIKMKIVEELEFELVTASRTGNSRLVPGLERALMIVEETE
jgi:hypothetical protein